MGSVFLELSKQRSLLKMMEERGFTLCQQNGQRTYGGPPPNWGSRPPPSRDCEVFIGRLPRMCFEDELIPLFLTAGELYEFRLMLDFSGTNRGYGYAHYATPAGAAKAIEKLNKYEIRPGHQIGVLKSKNNCRLLFGNLSSTLTLAGFNSFIRNVTDQVLNVLMFKSFQQLKTTDFSISSEMEEAFLGRVSCNHKNNQFAIVEYENHKAAAVARRILIPKYGHILAIDWAVPTREKKRYSIVNGMFPSVERPLPILKETITPLKTVSKVIPVPLLLIQPSPLDNVPFMSKSFYNVVKFFKYLLCINLYRSVSLKEIPLVVCKEIEKKIIDRVTNLENCSVAIQFIYNFLFWHAESKNQTVNPQVQKLLEETKKISDTFVDYVNRRLNQIPPQHPSEDHYFTHILPVHLNVLFRIILRCDWNDQFKLTESIEKGLHWLFTIIQEGNQDSKDFVCKIFKIVERESSASLDKATALAKSITLDAITDEFPSLSFAESMAGELRHIAAATSTKEGSKGYIKQTMENWLFTEGPKTASSGHASLIDQSMAKVETAPKSYPSVPVLLIEPSVINKVPFIPDIFNNVILFFKYIIKVCVNTNVSFLKIPRQINEDIDKKIISQISNIESCGTGIQMIITYFSGWINKNPPRVCIEAQSLLTDMKMYTDSFVKVAGQRVFSGNPPPLHVEEFFWVNLTLRLNVLFQLTLLLNAETPLKFAVNVSKGLSWLDDLTQGGDALSKQLIEEITVFIFDPCSINYDLMKATGDAFFLQANKDMCAFQEIVFPTTADLCSTSKSSSPVPSF